MDNCASMCVCYTKSIFLEYFSHESFIVFHTLSITLVDKSEMVRLWQLYDDCQIIIFYIISY